MARFDEMPLTSPAASERGRFNIMSKARAWVALSGILLGIGVLGGAAAIAQEGTAAPQAATESAAAAETETITAGSSIPEGLLSGIGAAFGAGLVIMGGAAGIGRIGTSAVESMARQPEVAGQVNVAMLITAAMIEGATLFAVVVCLLAIYG